MRPIIIAAAVLCFTPVQQGWAGFDEGMVAAKRGDLATALREFRPLAEQGDHRAQFLLGVMYQYGHGVHADYKAAVRWYRKAAEQGDAVAPTLLGSMYEYGRGVPQDYVQAYMWYGLAASVSAESNKDNRDRAAKARDLVASKMTPAQIAEAERLMQEWQAGFEKRAGD